MLENRLERMDAAINRLYRQWSEEIAEQCEYEGYPPYGSNYELRMVGVYDEATEAVQMAAERGDDIEQIARGYAETPVAVF